MEWKNWFWLLLIPLLFSCQKEEETCEDVDMGFIELTADAEAWIPDAYRLQADLRFENADGTVATLFGQLTDEQVRFRNLLVDCPDAHASSFHSYEAERFDIRYSAQGSSLNSFTLEFTVEPFQLPIEGSEIEFYDWIKVRANDLSSFIGVIQKQINDRGTNRLLLTRPAHFFFDSIELQGNLYYEVLSSIDENLFMTKEEGVVAVIDSEGVLWTKVD